MNRLDIDPNGIANGDPPMQGFCDMTVGNLNIIIFKMQIDSSEDALHLNFWVQDDRTKRSAANKRKWVVTLTPSIGDCWFSAVYGLTVRPIELHPKDLFQSPLTAIELNFQKN